MSNSELEKLVKKHLRSIAPEADLEELSPDDELGSALDIDSMDFYSMMVAISEELDVEIPEEEYGKLRDLNSIVRFLDRSGVKLAR